MPASGSTRPQVQLDPSLLTATVEKPQPVGTQKTSLRLGIPRESDPNENRIALTPEAVGVLTANGHEVYLEHQAGKRACYGNAEYTENGAVVVYEKKDLYEKADIVLKIAAPSGEELNLLRRKHTLISAVNLGSVTAGYLKTVLDSGATAIGYEFIRSEDGSLPFMQVISQIAGVASINIAANLLSTAGGGQGLLMGGVTGVPPALVTIVGAGTVGAYATRAALALGAQVRVLDESVHRMQDLERFIGHKVYTAVSSPNTIQEAVADADVLIGAAYIKGYRAPVVVTEDMITLMREGSVVIDVAIDQGGCVETSRLTNLQAPTFEYEGVIHYGVPNIASMVARTGSASISNLLTPLLLKLGKAGGVKSSLGRDLAVQSGVYAYHKHVTQRALADLFGLNFMDIELLYAANI